MGLLEFVASTSLFHPLKSVLSRGKVLVINAAGRESADDLAVHLREYGIKVYSYYMHPNNTIRFKVSNRSAAKFVLNKRKKALAAWRKRHLERINR